MGDKKQRIAAPRNGNRARSLISQTGVAPHSAIRLDSRHHISFAVLRAAALEANGNSVIVTDPAGTVLWVNPAFTRVTGYTAEEVIGRTPQVWSSGTHAQEFYQNLWDTILAGQAWHGKIVNRRKDASLYSEEMTILPVLSERGEILNFVSIKLDVTEHERDTEMLRRSEERYRRLVANLPDVTWTSSENGQTTYISQNVESVYGYTPEEICTRGEELWFGRIHPEDVERVSRGFQNLFSKNESFDAEYRIQHKNGEWIWVHDRALRTHTDKGVRYADGVFSDVTARKRAELALIGSEKRYRSLFENNLSAVFRAAAGGKILDCNPALVAMLGYGSREELLQRSAADILYDPGEERALLGQLAREASLSNYEIRLKRKDGAPVWALHNVALLQSEDGQPAVIEGTAFDISRRRRAEEELRHLAYYDAVTGLPNRTLLEDRLSKAMAAARRRKEKLALLFLDLDHFKVINDSLGHATGDRVLNEVATRLKKWSRDQDTVARLGGDEFVIVVNGVKEIGDVAVAARRVLDAMTAEARIEGRSLSIGCSLGISIFPDHGTDAVALLKNADAAMYSAKENGRNNFQFFTPEMNAQVVERLNLESDLRAALQNNELFLVYQPQSDIASGKLIGAEALLRWQHPKLGLIPPDKFIRIAENSGLILPIGEWVLRTACAQSRKWHSEGLPAVPVAVNVSAVQFRQEGFLDLIRRVLRETGLPPEYLELELTESLIMSNAESIVSMLRQLKETGVKLSIDDFGTGYSSLSYLRHFPVYKLKVDRSFVREVTANPDDAAITGTIISMAKSLNLKVIAEGVETEAQMRFLSKHRCDEVQGYYFSKPLSAADFSKFARGWGLLSAPMAAQNGSQPPAE